MRSRKNQSSDSWEFCDSSLTWDATLAKAVNPVYEKTDRDNFVKASCQRHYCRHGTIDDILCWISRTVCRVYSRMENRWCTVRNFRRILDCRRSPGMKSERNWINDDRGVPDDGNAAGQDVYRNQAYDIESVENFESS